MTVEKFWEFLFKPNAENGKSNRQNLWMYISALIMAGILLMLLSSKMSTPAPRAEATTPEVTDAVPTLASSSVPEDYEKRKEAELKHMLSMIQGVGRVEVDVTLEQGPEYVYGYDTSINQSKTNEKDNAGGIRVIEDMSESQELVIIRDNKGDERPVLKTELSPKIKGVLVVCEGAADPKVNSEVSRAVSTVLDVPLHKICVSIYKR